MIRSSLLLLIALFQHETLAEDEIRCVAQILVKNVNTGKPFSSSMLVLDYKVIFIPREYWENSCELDFPFSMESGIKIGEGVRKGEVKTKDLIFVIGTYNFELGESEFSYYTSSSQLPLLSEIT